MSTPGLNDRPTIEEIWEAINDWMEERSPSDPGERALAKVWLRQNKEHVKICPECDGECGEPCAISAEAHWNALCNPKPDRPSGESPWPPSKI